ncbi:embryonic polarity protein dorsal-like isoform X2 [Argiope bruennichi]|uniref:Embryonic polarity protein dorsal like protein n=1 Tax=Argiope bruennichi TaxID=94029 RepID=A0A8T0FXY6_ARGBR|nr:embryonic polarity protein dorsal-like isoform X2 [Argiope bruennichi]KAF8795964.1 Embryonic polarity protein dorsal like protein [Argiope bruennichi]
MLYSFLTDSLTISDVDEVIQSQLMDQMTQPTMPSNPGLQYTNKPYVRIIEQPAPRSLRFRYECEIEGRSAGSIVGINNTAENRTYPTIQVMNHQGPYAVVVSCVTKDGPPYRPHPHNLVGREGCKRGVCTLLVNNADMTCSFTSLGIQCVKKRDIEKSLKVREAHKLDPFGTGFSHPGNIDLNVLRLCFQVFIRGPDNAFSLPLSPVVSEPIYDKKAMSDLTIMKLSHYSAPVTGGTEVILLCDRVAKEDIQIWFYEEQGSRIVWESQAEFQPSDVHKQVAISFRTPRYPNENIQQPVPVFVELRKPSENKRGDPRPFQYLPMERDPEGLARKKLKVEDRIDLERYFQGNILSGASNAQEHQMAIGVPRISRQQAQQRVKPEPAVAGGATCVESAFGRVSTSFPTSEFSRTSNMPSVPVGVPSTSPHLTPAHSPNLAASPGAHSQSSATPPPHTSAIPSPVMQQMMQHSEASQQAPLTHPNVAPATVEESIIEGFDSLDLDSDLNLNLTQNLSASLFDSTPSITLPSTYQDASEDASHQ